jgi:hypothetical protein
MSIQQNSVLEAMKNEIPPEIIGGTDLDDAVKMVDLGIAHTPVVACHSGEYAIRPPPITESRIQDDGRYMLVYPRRHDFAFVSDNTLARQRARFILLSNYYLRRFHLLPHSQQQEVASTYLKDQAIPSANSPLAKLIGMDGCE